MMEGHSTVAPDIILDARGIHAWYGSSHVLHGIDLQITRGQTVGLLGRNGMGKSTLIRALLGHVTQREGLIQLFGRDHSKSKPHEVARSGVAYVPEGRGVFPNLSVRENLLMASKPVRDAKGGWTFDRVMATFPRLNERLTNLGSELSGGEQQMLSIGRALMGDPALLLLDEPLEGLAPIIVQSLLQSIERLIREEALTVILVEQSAKLALEVTQTALVLNRGRIAYSGKSAELLADPERLSALVMAG